MTDKEFNSKLKQLHNAHKKYQQLLGECEDEYERRFGFNPSDIDDDNWIDSFHINCIPANLQQVTEHAELALKLNG